MFCFIFEVRLAISKYIYVITNITIMSNINNLDPQAFGLITFKTTFGNIDIQLFTKQCPKATRNFIQLCLDGYYDNTIFEKVEKDFIAIGGTSKNKDTYEETFPDEFHPRLKFNRRGLLATANTKKNENGSKFFFTLGPTPELQNKHTIFGKAIGNSVYSLVELNDCQVDEDSRPYSEQRITEVLVVENPWSDVVSQRIHKDRYKASDPDENSSSDETYDPLTKPKPDPSESKKLSFHPDDDDDDNYSDDNDTNLHGSKDVKGRENQKCKQQSESELAKSDDLTFQGENTSLEAKQTDDYHKTIENPSGDEVDDREKRLREIRAQIQKIKEKIESETETKTLSERRQDRTSCDRHSTSLEKSADESQTKKSKLRERETIELVTNFKKKLKEAASTGDKNSRTKLVESQRDLDSMYEQDSETMDELARLESVDGDDWLRHKFVAEDDLRMAKDANTKDDSWYTIDDPRNRRFKLDDRSHRGKSVTHESSSSSNRHSREYRSGNSSRHHRS